MVNPEIAMIATRPGMQKDGSILVLFGDGHVERVPNIRTQEQLNEWLKDHSIKTED